MPPTLLLRAGSRVLIVAVMVAASIAALLGAFYGLWFLDDIFDTAFGFTAPVATPLELSPVVHGTIGESTTQYHEVIVYSYESLWMPRMLKAISYGLYFLLFVLACVAVIILCGRLLAVRGFTGIARWSMLAIGALAFVTSIAAPLLHSLSGELAARALGFPTSGGDLPGPIDEREWIVPSVFAIQDTNWALLVFGVMLILLAATYLRGERLQRDTDGLV